MDKVMMDLHPAQGLSWSVVEKEFVVIHSFKTTSVQPTSRSE